MAFALLAGMGRTGLVKMDGGFHSIRDVRRFNRTAARHTRF